LEKTEEVKGRWIDLGQVVDDLQTQYPKETKEHNQYFGNNEGWLTLYWCCIKFLRVVTPQPRNFDELDKNTATMLKAKGASMQEIAFVLGRSKSSVCEYLKQEE